nr:hypothetical protein [Salmonella sp.]
MMVRNTKNCAIKSAVKRNFGRTHMPSGTFSESGTDTVVDACFGIA